MSNASVRTIATLPPLTLNWHQCHWNCHDWHLQSVTWTRMINADEWNNCRQDSAAHITEMKRRGTKEIPDMLAAGIPMRLENPITLVFLCFRKGVVVTATTDLWRISRKSQKFSVSVIIWSMKEFTYNDTGWTTLATDREGTSEGR